MPATLSQTEDAIMVALRGYLLALLPAPVPEIFQAEQNRVAPPLGDYIVMTQLDRLRLASNVETWDPTDPNPVTIARRFSTEFRVQLDLHGAPGSDWACIIGTCWAGDHAFDAMPDGVKPLYATEAHRVPFRTGEQQYEYRWVLTLALQIAPIVSTAMQFAATLTPTLILVLGED